MNIWKIASRWSQDGRTGSVLDKFRKYQIIFVYNVKPDEKTKLDVEKKVKTDDLIAISDGPMMVSIGKVIKDPNIITDNWTFEDDMLDFKDEDVIAIKVKLIDLYEGDRLYYGKIGRFHALRRETANCIIHLWNKYDKSEKQNEFSINAKTCTLKHNNQNGTDFILNNQVKYIIPIYQRPYSWTDEQIRKFISDIFLSYWGFDRTPIEEPMFIGTMQLSNKKYINKVKSEQEIIDGQQRLTTFLILIKVLQTFYPNSSVLLEFKLNWLETRVNNGQQQLYINEFIESDLYEFTETLNPYLNNAYLIKEVIKEHISDEENNIEEFQIDRFVEYFTSKVYFVVIETFAGLSKTLQIFNAINTTGLDLNAGDVFKIRMYEYLRDKKGYDENAFNEVSKLYEKIDGYNKKKGWQVTDITGVLSIYQYILIAKYDLPNTLYSYGTDTFYERLFDSIFNINQWEHFKNLKNLELDIDEIDKIIEIRFYWEGINYPTAEDACLMHLFWWSRYSRYWTLVLVFLYQFQNTENHIGNLFHFIRQLSKLYTLYSVLFLKAIGDIHSFTYSLVKSILSNSFEEVIEEINSKITSSTYYRGDNKQAFTNDLNGEIVYNAKIKNIVCRLSAMLDENYQSTDDVEIEQIRKKLFDYPIDIEHIQSYNDSDGEKRQDILDEWNGEINSIGNLMVLEQSLNRSISNIPYMDKILRYPKSEYEIVKNQAMIYPGWNLSLSIERKRKETEKIIRYIFDNKRITVSRKIN